MSSVEQLDEFRAVTRRAQLQPWIPRGEAGRFVKQLRIDAVVLEQLPAVNRSSDPVDDPADNFLLAMAEAGAADYLVSGDRRGVLNPGSHGPTHIVTTRAMLAVLGIKQK